ncbi:MAG: hypothetical protein KA508_06910 [Gammaproteobacteria bacterium]|nr:hypothetical protein [Gammaproteobacteria bacterium]
MVYKDFIACVERHQTEKVRALYFESCCATTTIPDPILSSVPKLVQLLEKTEPPLCQKGQSIYLFGLQPCAMASHSDISRQHLCCVLKYLLLDDGSHQPSDWSGEHNIVIDFSTGEVMDNQRYLSKVFDQKSAGISYGMLHDADQSNTQVHAITLKKDLNIAQKYYDC